MKIDLSRSGPVTLNADVAVIGAGAAGISTARRLLAAGLSVLLLESGGLDHEPAAAALNDGASVGADYYPLRDARLRFFGGTTAIWGGRCSPLDPIDFERRPWVPLSGWPIGAEDVAPYIAEARQAFGLSADEPEPTGLRAAGVGLPAFDPEELVTPIWSFDGRFDRFRHDHCRDVIDHPRAIVLLHATVRRIRLDESLGAVSRLDLIDPKGRCSTAFARHHVLAAGGIENPRILLASDAEVPEGVGNGHGWVGRCFMEHPHARGGRIVGGAPWQLLNAFAKHRLPSGDVAALIAAAPALQRREGLLNTSLTIAARRPAGASEAWMMRAYLAAKHNLDPGRAARSAWMGTKRAVGWVQRYSEPLRPWLLHKAGRVDLALVVRAEQAPNPDSRVTLTGERDALGMPRVALDWRMSAQDRESVAGLVRALGRECARLGLGTVEPAAWLEEAEGDAWATDPLISAHPIGGYHHMGTTRMAASPREGVADGNGRVHGVANLHIAGSSLFPTGGWANPTLTIVALSMRTADHIVASVGRPLAGTPPKISALAA